jgi:hypothetical protein
VTTDIGAPSGAPSTLRDAVRAHDWTAAQAIIGDRCEAADDCPQPAVVYIVDSCDGATADWCIRHLWAWRASVGEWHRIRPKLPPGAVWRMALEADL